jgi:hypothetical protein
MKRAVTMTAPSRVKNALLKRLLLDGLWFSLLESPIILRRSVA